MNNQRYYWACILEDGSHIYEYQENGETANYDALTPEERDKTFYFGLTSNEDGYFFDLKTGEIHIKTKDKEVKSPITISLSDKRPSKISGPLENGKKYEFFQYKQAHQDVTMSGHSLGNVIDAHVIGYNVVKKMGGKAYLLEIKLSIDPKLYPSKPVLEVTLKTPKDGKKIGVYSVNLQ